MPTAKQLDEVIALLVARFPNTFAVFQERRKPLKLKIHLDLIAALGEGEHVNAALGYYCRNIGYQRALKPGAARIDLEGNEAG
jgi:sRNA-binding protein